MTTDSVRQEKGDTIYRQDAIEVINKLMEIHFDRKVVLGKVWQQIKDLPSAQKKGHWNFVGDNLFKCTCCGEMYTTQQLNGLRVYDKDPYCPFFCPHCGADMRGETDA